MDRNILKYCQRFFANSFREGKRISPLVFGITGPLSRLHSRFSRRSRRRFLDTATTRASERKLLCDKERAVIFPPSCIPSIDVYAFARAREYSTRLPPVHPRECTPEIFQAKCPGVIRGAAHAVDHGVFSIHIYTRVCAHAYKHIPRYTRRLSYFLIVASPLILRIQFGPLRIDTHRERCTAVLNSL